MSDQNITNAQEQYEMGMRCLKGEGAEKNLKNALYWLVKAATQGHEGAENKLNELSDEDVTNAEYQAVIGRYYYDRGLIAEDNSEDEDFGVRYFKKAVYWLEKAAEQGIAHAQYRLAFGLKKMDDNMEHGDINNYEEALEWAEEALKQKDEFSPENIKELEELIEALKQELTDHYTSWKEESD
jgi:TPR repeat protein